MRIIKCQCIDNFDHIDYGKSYGKILVNLQKNKIYECEHLDTEDYTKLIGMGMIRVYDGERFIYFNNESDFLKYFTYNSYVRKKKLEKLNNL